MVYTMIKLKACGFSTLLLLAAGWMTIVLPVLMETSSRAQSPMTSPSFAVATIKPNRTGNNGGGGMFFPGGRYEAINLTVKDLIRVAYGIPYSSRDQISGGPVWIKSARFDVEAKAEQPLSAEVGNIPNHDRLMLQTLLASRFKLRIHHEAKELPIYALIVAKNGPKLMTSLEQPTSSSDKNPDVVFGAKLPPPQNESWRGTRLQKRGQIKAMRATTGMLVTFLQDQPEIGGRLVIDKTGLAGSYDFMLKWTPEVGMSGAGDAGASPDASGPSLFTALQEELGLKLDATKGWVDTIVVDSVEMPSEN
jgi:uncharacterized protein (TIGR03435 family)